MVKNSTFYQTFFLITWCLLFLPVKSNIFAQTGNTIRKASHPNIIVILTDDQGIGDIGYEGNPYIKTPNLDHLASKSTRLTNFYVSPVCAPTRSSIMTGKFSEETGIFDTFHGGAIMASSEKTIAEILSNNGYRTGIIGKWHLGDSYPFRPMDQGFSYSLTFKSGGIGQSGDVKNFFAGDSSYFSPVLWQNGTPVQTNGYCTNVFTNRAIKFINSKKKQPFFLYLAYNVPHKPLQVPKKYYNLYKNLSFNNYTFGHESERMRKMMTKKNLDDARKVYGMMTNLDDNIGRLMKALEKRGMQKNTIIIFLSDNGPAENRFKLGLRGRKADTYEGGIKVPAFMYSPNLLPQEIVPQVAAHIDLLPTILDFAHLHDKIPQDIAGESLLPIIRYPQKDHPAFNKRMLFWEWGRGYPVPFQNMAVRRGNYKLVGSGDFHAVGDGQHTGYHSKITDFDLYNIKKDPKESKNIIASHIDTARALKKELAHWYQSIIHNKVNRTIRWIQVGTRHENPVILDRNDAFGNPHVSYKKKVGANIYGYWNVQVKTSGLYTITLKFANPIKHKGTVQLKLLRPYHYTLYNSKTGITELTMRKVPLDAGKFKLEAYYQSHENNFLMPFYVEVKKIN